MLEMGKTRKPTRERSRMGTWNRIKKGREGGAAYYLRQVPGGQYPAADTAVTAKLTPTTEAVTATMPSQYLIFTRVPPP
jgi:hypothetical protein